MALTDNEKSQAVALYESGMSQTAVAKRFGITYQAMVRHLKKGGAQLRSQNDAARLSRGHDLQEDVFLISDQRWRDLYDGPGSGYPSVGALSQRFGVSWVWMKTRLLQAGAVLRTRGQQIRIEARLGRKRCVGGGGPGRWEAGDTENPFRNPKVRRKALKARNEVAVAQRTRNHAPCDWCGTDVWRWPSRIRGHAHRFCNRDCKGKWQRHMARHRDEPRPVILDRLRAGDRNIGETQIEIDEMELQRMLAVREQYAAPFGAGLAGTHNVGGPAAGPSEPTGTGARGNGNGNGRGH